MLSVNVLLCVCLWKSFSKVCLHIKIHRRTTRRSIEIHLHSHKIALVFINSDMHEFKHELDVGALGSNGRVFMFSCVCVCGGQVAPWATGITSCPTACWTAGCINTSSSSPSATRCSAPACPATPGERLPPTRRWRDSLQHFGFWNNCRGDSVKFKDVSWTSGGGRNTRMQREKLLF